MDTLNLEVTLLSFENLPQSITNWYLEIYSHTQIKLYFKIGSDISLTLAL